MIHRASVQFDSTIPGPWSFSAGRAHAMLVGRADGGAELIESGRVVRSWNEPISGLNWLEEDVSGRPAGFRWAGYLSYDLGRFFEHLPAGPADDLKLPLYIFSLHESDNTRLAEVASPAKANRRGFDSNFSKAGYERAVERIKGYIAAGDVYQVNLSQRISASLDDSAEQVYARLKERYPAHYGALLDYADFALVCNSPELFLRVGFDASTGARKVITRPIKGTRPRLPGMEEELLNSAKDAAELNMIVDLERNDLGRVCRVGSVRVSQARMIEAHPTVYQGVAEIEGELRDEVGLVELLAAMFPGGSVTGAPKIRAMQIIDELEPVRRGPYCGAIGYLDSEGWMEFNVAIRTIIAVNGMAYVPVGGGVVSDSKPAEEYEETLVKARAMLEGLGVECEI